MQKLLTYILLIIVISITLGSTVVLAAPDDYEPTIIPQPTYLGGQSEDSQRTEGLTNYLIRKVLPAFAVGTIGLVGGMSILFLVISGVRLATTYGNDESYQNAKNQIIYALVGLVIAILSFTVVRIITNVEFVNDTTQQPETIRENVEDAVERIENNLDRIEEEAEAPAASASEPAAESAAEAAAE